MGQRLGHAVSVAKNRPERYAKDITRALRDPGNPDCFLPEYDSGDHLRPSAAGYNRMAMEIPAQILK